MGSYLVMVRRVKDVDNEGIEVFMGRVSSDARVQGKVAQAATSCGNQVVTVASMHSLPVIDPLSDSDK